MLRKDDILFIKDTIVPHSAPLLSLYADGNPANPDNAGRAWLVRVKNTLRSLSLPRDLPEKVIQALESERPEAHTCALFAGKDHLLVASWSLGVKVLRCAGRLLVQDRSAAEAFCPGQSVQEVCLSDVLPELAAAHGARLELVQGHAEDRLIRDFDRLAGLPRW